MNRNLKNKWHDFSIIRNERVECFTCLSSSYLHKIMNAYKETIKQLPFIVSASSVQDRFHLTDFNERFYDLTNETVAKPFKAQLASAVYLQVSTISQALIFVTRSHGWSFTERPGLLLVAAFIIAQLVSLPHNLALF